MIFKIGSIPYELEIDKIGDDLYGRIDYINQKIYLCNKKSKDRIVKTLLHELLHGIIEEYAIEALMLDDKNHNENAIDQLSTGLKEALSCIGYDFKEIFK